MILKDKKKTDIIESCVELNMLNLIKATHFCVSLKELFVIISD